MAHEITGKVVQLLPEQTGTGKNGLWTRHDFVIETEEQFPKKVCFSGWGDKAALVKNLQPGSFVKVSFNIESREYNSRWYTDLRIWKIEVPDQSVNQGAPGFSDAGLEPLSATDSEGADNDLPF
jgi:hypothetical protein